MNLLEYIKRPKSLIRDIQKSNNALFNIVVELLSIPVLYALCFLAATRSKPIDVGLGPEPLINNLHHKKGLIQNGYTAETFAYTDNFISSDYDINLAKHRWSRLFKALYLFCSAIFKYKALFIYFNGGPLFNTRILKFLEPTLLSQAEVKVIVMPFGSDVQVMQRTPNLYFRHTLAQDYPAQNRQHQQVAENIERWTLHADWVISGCEWVYYMAHWDSLQLAHFSIDLEQWQPVQIAQETQSSFRIFHAPNHKTIKGTQELINAVEALKKEEGLNIELVLMRGVSNEVIRETIATVDLVADQFVIGWYALFAIEAMALEKPVLCYLRPDLVSLYTKAGLVAVDEIPLINTDLLEIREKIRWAYHDREKLREIGQKGRDYVQKHHSTHYIGREFAKILSQLGIFPSQPPSLPHPEFQPTATPKEVVTV